MPVSISGINDIVNKIITVDASDNAAITTTVDVSIIKNSRVSVAVTPDGDFNWARAFDGPGNENAFSITTDSQGDIYITGKYQYGVVEIKDGDTVLHTLPEMSGIGAFVVKLTSTGSFVWARVINGSATGTGIAIDDLGDVFICGYYQLDADVKDGDTVIHSFPTVSGNGVFVVKLTSTGSFVWSRIVDGSSSARVKIDDGGNVVVTGSYSSARDVLAGATVMYTLPAGVGSSVYVIKLTNAGSFVWARTIDGSSTDQARGIATDSEGSVLVTGQIQQSSTATVKDGTTVLHTLPTVLTGAFVVKLTSAGSFAWARVVDGTGSDRGTDIATDTDGNVFATGSYATSANIKDGTTVIHTLPTVDDTGLYVVKLTSAGSFVWARVIDGIYHNSECITIDYQGNVVVSGEYYGAAEVKDGATVLHTLPTISSTTIAFVIKLTNAGSFTWARIIGGGGDKFGNSVTTDFQGNVILSGYYSSTAEIRDGNTVLYTLPASVGNASAFVVALKAEEEVTTVDPYTLSPPEDVDTMMLKKIIHMPNANGDVATINVVDAQDATLSTVTVGQTSNVSFIWADSSWSVVN